VQEPLDIADIGCSLNLGLRASIRGYMLRQDLNNFEDGTPNNFIDNLLRKQRPEFSYALGIDLQEADFEWVASCAYFSKYDENRELLSRYWNQLKQDKSKNLQIHEYTGDILSKKTTDDILIMHPQKFHIMY